MVTPDVAVIVSSSVYSILVETPLIGACCQPASLKTAGVPSFFTQIVYVYCASVPPSIVFNIALLNAAVSTTSMRCSSAPFLTSAPRSTSCSVGENMRFSSATLAAFRADLVHVPPSTLEYESGPMLTVSVRVTMPLVLTARLSVSSPALYEIVPVMVISIGASPTDALSLAVRVPASWRSGRPMNAWYFWTIGEIVGDAAADGLAEPPDAVAAE